jgi:putative spermidine/putrescine transport system substrate-binding protein
MPENSYLSRLSGLHVSRRGLFAGAVGVAAAATLAGCAPLKAETAVSAKPTAKSGTAVRSKLALTMFCFLGGNLAVMPKEFAADYTKRHPNVTVTFYEESNAIGYGKMLAQRQADPSKPLVNFGFFNTSTTSQGVGDGMWRKLDYSAMSNSHDIVPSFTRSDHYGIGIGSDQVGLLYNPKTVKKEPKAWSDLWKTSSQGELSFFGLPWYAVLMAARAHGGSEKKMDPGFTLWEKEADRIRLIVESNPQYLNVLSDGTAPLTSYFAGTGQQWIDGGAPLKYVVPSEGAIPVPVYLQSVAGQSDDENEVIQDMINEMISPKWTERWAETSVEIPANSLAKLPKDLAKLPAFQKSTVKNFIDIDWDIIGKNTPAWTDRWNSDVVSKI